MTDIDPPVLTDDGLTIRCDHSGCSNTNTVGTDVDAKESNKDSGWRIAFTPAADGRLEVDGVECPEHRIDAMIDQLAAKQSDLATGISESLTIARKVADE